MNHLLTASIVYSFDLFRITSSSNTLNNIPPYATTFAMDQGTTNDYFHLFRYYPNLGAAILFIILFAIASIYHSWAFITTRTWFFAVFAVGCWC